MEPIDIDSEAYCQSLKALLHALTLWNLSRNEFVVFHIRLA